MVRIDNHVRRMKEIQQQIDHSTGRKKLELIKCYHRLNKQLLECQGYLKKAEAN